MYKENATNNSHNINKGITFGQITIKEYHPNGALTEINKGHGKIVAVVIVDHNLNQQPIKWPNQPLTILQDKNNNKITKVKYTE